MSSPNKESEAALFKEFKAYHHTIFTERLNILLYLGIVIVPMFGWLDSIIHPELFKSFLTFRVATTILALFLLVINNTRWREKLSSWLATLVVIVMTVRVTAMVIMLGGETSSYYVAIILFMMGILTIVPFLLPMAILNCAIAFAIYLGGLLIFDTGITSYKSLINNTFFLFVAFGILCSASYFNCKSRFRDFKLRRALDDSQAKIQEYANNLEDIVEQRTREKLALENQLFQSQKMEAIGNMAGGIAHDFNNMLWTVMGYTSFIRNIRSEDKELNEHLNMIERSTKQAAGLTKQLLSLSRKGTPEVKPLNIGEVVEEAAALLEKSIKHNIHFEVDLDQNIQTVEIDANQFQQAIINLGVNANHAMENGGTLTLKVSNCLLSEALGEIPAGSYVLVAISDTGHGIPEGALSKIFEPFFTTKPEGVGTGLGLAMVYRMIQNHKGFIKVKSTIGLGTTFSIYIPTVDKLAHPLHEKQEDQSIAIKGEGTVLVVDNEEPLRKMLSKILQSMGYQILQAESGEQAIEMFTAKPQLVDLIIMDLNMPGMNGREAFLKLKERAKDVKVIISSGYLEAEDVEDMLDSGVAGILAKPFGVMEISKKIHQVLGR